MFFFPYWSLPLPARTTKNIRAPMNSSLRLGCGCACLRTLLSPFDNLLIIVQLSSSLDNYYACTDNSSCTCSIYNCWGGKTTTITTTILPIKKNNKMFVYYFAYSLLFYLFSASWLFAKSLNLINLTLINYANKIDGRACTHPFILAHTNKLILIFHAPS